MNSLPAVDLPVAVSYFEARLTCIFSRPPEISLGIYPKKKCRLEASKAQKGLSAGLQLVLQGIERLLDIPPPSGSILQPFADVLNCVQINMKGHYIPYQHCRSKLKGCAPAGSKTGEGHRKSKQQPLLCRAEASDTGRDTGLLNKPHAPLCSKAPTFSQECPLPPTCWAAMFSLSLPTAPCLAS